MASPTARVALITGAGSGIGRAVALALLGAGWRVALAGRRREPLEETAAHGRRACRPTLLPSRPTSPTRLPSRPVRPRPRRPFGRLDLLFNNAGIGAPPIPLEDLTFEQWKAVVDVNLTGAFLCTQAAFRLMKAQDPARRPHHQQRLDLGPCPAAQLRALHGHQARHHRPDQVAPRSTAANYDIACGQIDIGNAAHRDDRAR